MKQSLVNFFIAVWMLAWPLAFAVAQPQAAGKQVIKVGFIGSLSSFAAQYGRAVLNGVELARDELEASGWKVELVIEDDASEMKNAVAAYQKLRADGGLDALITGTWWANALTPIAERDPIPVLSCQTVLDKGTIDAPNYFIMEGDLKDWIRVHSPFIAKRGFRSGAILRFSSGFGETLAGAMREEFEKSGRRFLGDFEYSDIQGTDAVSQLVRLKSLRPEALYIDAQPAGLATILKRMRELKMDATTVLTNSIAAAVLEQKLLPPSEFGNVVFSQRISLGGEPERKYRARFGAGPALDWDLGYLALHAAARASERPDPVAAIRSGAIEVGSVKIQFLERNVFAGIRHGLFTIDPVTKAPKPL